MSNLLAAGSQLLAEPGPKINTTGIVAWIVTYLIPIFFAIAAIRIFIKAHKQQTRESATLVGNLLLGCIVLVAGASLLAFGKNLVGLILGTG